jgi:spore maturation protein CgeB
LRFVFFVHSLVSDWNHGNAHFLRGVMRELQRRGHDAVSWEPRDAWSRKNLERDHGEQAVERFVATFPSLHSVAYDPDALDIEQAVDGADVVIVHEWNEPSLVARLGRRRRRGDFTLLFHDTHHRAATAPREMARYDLSAFDGVLCFGEVIRRLYLDERWAQRAWVWHEAADTALFRPQPGTPKTGDLVWIGNWGDDERSDELRTFLIGPVRDLRPRTEIYGVRYPAEAIEEIEAAGARYGGWLPNAEVPHVFAAHRVTVHVPRRPYVRALPGIPTIRVFEALACGIPLVSAPWRDAEALFRPGYDFLMARDGDEMREMIRAVLADPVLAADLASSGLETIRTRHTCAHRVDELLEICACCRSEVASAEPWLG